MIPTASHLIKRFIRFIKRYIVQEKEKHKVNFKSSSVNCQCRQVFPKIICWLGRPSISTRKNGQGRAPEALEDQNCSTRCIPQFWDLGLLWDEDYT